MAKNRAPESKSKDEAPGEMRNHSHRKARRGPFQLTKLVKGKKLGKFMPGNLRLLG